MEIGTNRPDAMNHYGVAREAAAIYDLPLKPITPQLASTAKAADHSDPSAAKEPLFHAEDRAFPITVEEPALCPRFSARVIRNTTIKPSPEKVAHRLQLLDQRPISNAVDATNYVLWEIGKPTHVFDMDLLEGGEIIVRKARHGETLKTLDGVERKLTTEDLVVCDAKKPVGLAGVMGGYDTMITEKTRNIVIESAWWDPGIVRKMSRRHGTAYRRLPPLRARSGFRIHRPLLRSGCADDSGLRRRRTGRRRRRCCLEEDGPGSRRACMSARCAAFWAADWMPGQIFRLLKRLGFTLIPEGQGDAQFRVQIPSWRLDVEREIDVIEEIARLHGYDKFREHASRLQRRGGGVTARIDRRHVAQDVLWRSDTTRPCR